MRVTVLLYNPPGRGEYLRQVIEMPEDSIPTKDSEFRERSIAAVKHFWPQANVGRAETVGSNTSGNRFIVDGVNWSVEWAMQAYVDTVKKFIDDCNDAGTSIPFVMEFAEKSAITGERTRL